MLLPINTDTITEKIAIPISEPTPEQRAALQYTPLKQRPATSLGFRQSLNASLHKDAATTEGNTIVIAGQTGTGLFACTHISGVSF